MALSVCFLKTFLIQAINGSTYAKHVTVVPVRYGYIDVVKWCLALFIKHKHMLRKHTRTHTRTHSRTHTHTHARTQARTHAHTHKHTCTHTHWLHIIWNDHKLSFTNIQIKTLTYYYLLLLITLTLSITYSIRYTLISYVMCSRI